MTHGDHCPRCKSNRVDYHCALGTIKRVCATCGEEWGDLMGYGAAPMRIREEERAKPQPPRGEGPPMVLLGVNPWLVYAVSFVEIVRDWRRRP